MKAKDIMTPDPIVAEAPGTREDVLRLFVRHKVSTLPVVRARTRELVGVVTRNDVFRSPEEQQLALIMTRDPITLTPDHDVADAARIFHARAIHSLPIVEDGQLVGVISPTDVLKVLGDTNGHRVSGFVRSAAVPVWEGTPLPVAWEIMRLAKLNALPVVDDQAALAGIFSDSDLFSRSDVEESIGRHELGIPEQDDEWAWDNIKDIAPLYYAKSRVQLPPIPVREIMEREVVTVFEGAPVGDAARKLVKHGINQLPVVDANDRLVGMITDIDLCAAIATHDEDEAPQQVYPGQQASRTR